MAEEKTENQETNEQATETPETTQAVETPEPAEQTGADLPDDEQSDVVADSDAQTDDEQPQTPTDEQTDKAQDSPESSNDEPETPPLPDFDDMRTETSVSPSPLGKGWLRRRSVRSVRRVSMLYSIDRLRIPWVILR